MKIHELIEKNYNENLLSLYTPYPTPINSLSVIYKTAPRQKYGEEQSIKICGELKELAISLFGQKEELNDEMLGILYFTLIDFCEISMECVMKVFYVSKSEINDKKMILDTSSFLESIGLLDTLKFFLFFMANYELNSLKH